MDILPLRNPLRGEQLRTLISKLEESEAKQRYLAAQALGEQGTKASPATNCLIDKLKDSCPKVRYFATQAIGNVATEPTPAVETLLKTILNKKEPYSECAAEVTFRAIVKLGLRFPEQVVPKLIEQLDSSKAAYNQKMSECLLTIGEAFQSKLMKYLDRAVRSNNQNLKRESEKLLSIVEMINRKKRVEKTRFNEI